MLFFRGLHHLLGQAANQFFVLPFQEQEYILDGLSVLLLGAESPNTGSQSALDMVFEAGPVQVSVNIQSTGPQQEMAVDDLDGVACQ